MHLFSIRSLFVLLFAGNFLLFQNCCWRNSGDLLETYRLTQEQRELIVYEQEQELSFVHSQGYLFDLQVFTDEDRTNDREGCEDYNRFEFKEAVLRSELPFFKLRLRVFATSPDSENDAVVSITAIGVSPSQVKNYFFRIDENPISIDLNGETLSDVFVYESFNEEFYISTIFYSASIGLIKLEFLNGEYVELQN